MKLSCALAAVFLVTLKLALSQEFAEREAARFVASIRKRPIGFNVYETEFLCVGVLVSLTHVLTAGSCVRGLGTPQLVVIVGSLELNSMKNGSSHVVEEIKIHPDFSGQGHKHNIALLQINSASRTICTPSPLGAPKINDLSVQMLGWSGMKETLQVTRAVINMGTSCPYKEVGVICATDEHNTATEGNCGGNFGGPVYFSDQFVAAIVVDDQFCGTEDAKGAYLILLEYHGWIRDIMASGALRVVGRTMFILTIVSLRTKF